MAIIDPADVLLVLGLDAPTDQQKAWVDMAIRGAEGAVINHLHYDPAQAARTEYYPQTQANIGVGMYTWEVNNTHAYERRVSGAVSDELQLQHIPIRSISDLRVDYDGRSGTRSGAFGSDTVKTEGTDFWANYSRLDSAGAKLCADGILRSIGIWPDNAGSVKVTYTAGYTADELRGVDTVVNAFPIFEAVMDEAIRRFHRILSRTKSKAGFVGPVTSEGLGEYNYNRDQALYSRLVGGTDVMPENKERLAPFVNWGWMIWA